MSRLTIHKGVFRSDQKSVDVTGKLASLIEDDILKLHSDFASTLSVQLEGGDKALEIEFSVDSGEVQTVRVADGGPLYISCPPVSSGSASSSSSSSSAAAPDYGLCAAGHPLTKGHNGYASGWLCDHCRYSAAESQERVICSPCKADFCDTCAPKHVNTKKIRCRSGHQLYLSNNKEGGYSSGYVCRECAKQKTGWRWFCEPCTDDLCPDCYEKFTPSDVVFPEPGRFEGDLGGDWAAEEANADLTTLRLWFRPRKAGEAVRLRKLYLVPRSDLPVSPESGSPIPYYAVVEGATLKKSKGQDAFTSQDATAGKYAAQKLCWSKTDKGRLVATPKRGSDAVAVVLRPPHGTAVFPSFSAIRLAFVADSSSSSEGSSSSGAQQPELVRIEAVPRGESGWIPVAHEGKKDTVDVGTGLRLFRPTEALLSKLSGHDGAALRAAFNHMPPALHGFALAPSALTQLLSAALAKRSAETLALLLSQVELQPMVYDETLRLLLADYQGGNDFVESAVRLVFSSGPRPGLPAFAQAFALGRPAVVDLLATLEPSILSDYAEELVQVALAVDYDYVRYVASSIASVQNPAPKQLPSLPSLSVLTNPSPAVLLAAHRSPDRRAFDELIAVSTRGSLAAFFNEVFAGRLSECTPALLRAGFDKGVELTAVVRPDSNVLDLALASHQSELASLLFRQGLRCHVGNARALLRAFQSRDDAAFSLLEAEGCPVPLYHLFALLTANAELAEESIDRALRILFAPGRLTPNSQLPRAGRSLVAQALAAKNIPLASRLVAQGASLPESDGPSIFAQAFRDGVPARALAAAIEFRSPHDKDILQPALLAYLRQCPANDVDNLHRFLRAVPDLDFEVDGVAPLTAALDNASVDLEVVNALLSAGAKAPEGFALDLIPKYFESLLFPQYLHLVEQDSNINYANLLCRLMVNSPAVLKTIVGREIVAHILGQSPDLSSPVDYVIQSNVEGPHVDRFGHASMSWGYSGSPDAISFSVSQPLTLMGIGAYGGQSGDYNVRVELREGTCALSGEVLASATETFQCPGSEITPILFDVPVQLSDNTQYTAVINYSSTISTYYGQDGQTSVNVGDITFNFQTPSDGSHNGTTNTSGQIPRLYIKGNSKGGRPDNFEPLPLLAVAALTQKDEALFDRLYAAGSRLPSVAPETKRGKTLFDRSYQAALKNYSDLTSVLSAYLSSKKSVGEFLRALQKLPARAVAYTPSLVEAFLAECTDPGLLLAQALQANSDIVQLPFGKAIVDYALEKSPDFSRSFPVESGGEPLSARRLASVSSSSSNWGYSGTPDSIAFKVSEPVLITGIGAVGGSGSDYRVTISIREGNTASGTVLGSALREFTSSDSTIVPLSFDEPIAVEPDVYYCAVICYESRHNTYSGESGLGTLTVDDVRFEFQSTSDNNNGTSVSSGQVHSLLFTKGLAIGDNPLELPLLAIAAFTQKNGALFDTLYQAGARNLPAPDGLTPEQSELRAKLIQKGFKNLLRYGANPISAFDSFFDPSNVKPSEFVGLCDSLPDDSSEHVEELAAKFLQARGTDGAAALIHDLMDSDSNILAKDIARSLIEKSLESRPNAATRFPFTYRTSTSEAKRFGSVSSSNSNWGYGGDADAIAFQVSKPVYIYGLTAIGGQGEYSASIELRTGTGSNSGELLASASHTFNSSDDSLIPLHFETPVWVEEDTNYTAVIRIQSDLSSHSGQSGSATVDVDGVTFRFSSASDENNGTDVSSGQVHSLLFSENASATVVQPGQKIEQITCNLPLVLIAALSQKTPELFKLLSQSEITPTPAASDSLSAVVVETTLVRHALATVLEFTSIDEVASTFELFESFGYERGNLLLGVLSNSLRKLFEDDDPQEVCELLGSLLDSEEIDHSACSTDGNMLSLAIRNGYSPDIIAILLRNGADITAAENFRTPAGRHVGPLLNLAFEAYIDESPEWLAEIAGQLIDAGLNPNEAADDHFPTPHYIAWNTRKSNSARQSKTVEFLALLKERGLNPSLPLSDYSAGSDFQKKYGFAYAATLTPVKFAKGEVREWFTAQAE